MLFEGALLRGSGRLAAAARVRGGSLARQGKFVIALGPRIDRAHLSYIRAASLAVSKVPSQRLVPLLEKS